MNKFLKEMLDRKITVRELTTEELWAGFESKQNTAVEYMLFEREVLRRLENPNDPVKV